MFLLEHHYRELAEEVLKQTEEAENVVFGVVDIEYDRWELIVGFEWDRGSIVRWMDIAFENGIRCSSNFEIEHLRKWL